MTAWVNRQLDLTLYKKVAAIQRDPEAIRELRERMLDPSLALAAAIKKKDLATAEKLFSDPQVRREYLKSVMRSRGGQPGQRATTMELHHLAKTQIKLVRELWQQHYGKKNRGKLNRPSAETIVLDRLRDMGFKVTARALGLKSTPIE